MVPGPNKLENTPRTKRLKEEEQTNFAQAKELGENPRVKRIKEDELGTSLQPSQEQRSSFWQQLGLKFQQCWHALYSSSPQSAAHPALIAPRDSSPIALLPDEILWHFFSFASEKQLLSLRQVSAQFKAIIDSTTLLLNTKELQDELQMPIISDQDRQHLFMRQQEEIVYLSQHHADKLPLLTPLPQDHHPLSLYIRHKALNAVNAAIIKSHVVYTNTLSLRALHLTRLPLSILNDPRFAKLEFIDLAHNALSTLPKKLEEISTLVSVDISHNLLKEIPASSKWIRLQWLRANHNHLSSLPDPITDCVSLSLLDASFNQLESVPEELDTLPLLRQVNLVENQLESLPRFSPGILTNGYGPISSQQTLSRQCKRKLQHKNKVKP